MAHIATLDMIPEGPVRVGLCGMLELPAERILRFEGHHGFVMLFPQGTYLLVLCYTRLVAHSIPTR